MYLDRSSIGSEPYGWTAFAYSSRCRRIVALIIDAQSEIALNLAVIALRIHLKPGFVRQADVDFPAGSGNVHVSQRRLGLHFDVSSAVINMNAAGYILQVDILSLSA